MGAPRLDVKQHIFKCQKIIHEIKKILVPGVGASPKGINTPSGSGIFEVLTLAMMLGNGLGSILERHNAFQWDLATAADAAT